MSCRIGLLYCPRCPQRQAPVPISSIPEGWVGVRGDVTIPRGWRPWLRPGMHLKRWAALFLLGTILTGLAIAMGLVYSYRYVPFPEPVSGLVQVITLQFLPRELRYLIVLGVGIASMVYGLYRFSRELILPVLAHSKADKDLVQIVAEHRFGLSRPEINVVAIGGGTGLATLLRGLKRHDVSITAIVTVADDGGSTGKIRTAYDIPAPGDIRNCLVALADDESLVSRLFQYRFTQAGSELDGHSLGNLFITALTKVSGSFEQAVIESAAVLNADLIVLGPGSLYTSIVPNLLVPDIVRAVRASSAPKVYVMNVATQSGETDHFTALDHLAVVDEQLGPGELDAVLINSNMASAEAIGPDLPIEPLLPDSWDRLDPRIRVIARDVVSEQNPLRHDPEKLATALFELTNGHWREESHVSEVQRSTNNVSARRRDLV